MDITIKGISNEGLKEVMRMVESYEGDVSIEVVDGYEGLKLKKPYAEEELVFDFEELVLLTGILNNASVKDFFDGIGDYGDIAMYMTNKYTSKEISEKMHKLWRDFDEILSEYVDGNV